MELQLLRCFVAVGEELHISNAAERLRVAAPTLSEAIQRLEYGLGLRLFVRLRHGVTLTPAGHAFLPAARRVLTDFEEGVRAAQTAEVQTAEVLRVGYVCHVDAELISAITAEFQRRRREWRLEMRRADPADPAAGTAEEARDGGNVVTLLRLPVPGRGRLEGTLEGTVNRPGAPTEPFSLQPYGAGPHGAGPHGAGSYGAGSYGSYGAGRDMARPEVTGRLREFLAAGRAADEATPRAAPDTLDLSDWFGEAVAHQAIGIMTETTVTGSPESSVREVETTSSSVISAVWPRGDTEPVIADFLQACIAAVLDRTPRAGA